MSLWIGQDVQGLLRQVQVESYEPGAKKPPVPIDRAGSQDLVCAWLFLLLLEFFTIRIYAR